MTLTYEDLDRARTAFENHHIEPPSENQCCEYAHEFIKWCRADPAMQRYVHDLNSVTGEERPPIRTPLQVYGEKMMFAMSLLADLIGTEGIKIRDFDSLDMEEHWFRVRHALQIVLAVPFLWSKEIATQMLTNDMPRHIISRKILSFPIVWWTFEVAHGVANQTGTSLEGRAIDAMLIADEGVGLNVLKFCSENYPHDASCELGGIKYGQRYPEDAPGAQNILAGAAFLNSPYITQRQENIPRAFRRQAQRAGLPDFAQHDVRFVKLRTPESQPSKPGDNDIERDHRWLVRGHYRAQWHPSEQAHHLIWIMPHLKGPDGLPVKNPMYSVVR